MSLGLSPALIGSDEVEETEDGRMGTILGRNLANIASMLPIASPINRLPMDTLVAVFLGCQPMDVEADPSDGPYILCQICRKWREVALSTPGLWSCLQLRADLDKLDAHTSLLNTHITRSAESPFSFTLDGPTGDWNERTNLGIPLLEPYHRYIRSIMSSLISITHRWYSIEIDMPIQRMDAIKTLATASFRDNPVLEYLRLDLLIPEIENQALTCQSTFAPFKELRALNRLHLALPHTSKSWRTASLPLPWDNIRQMTLMNGAGVADTLAVIDRCKRMVTGSFTITGLDAIQGLVPNVGDHLLHFTHKKLEELRVYADGPLDIFFQYLTIPTLMTLEISFHWGVFSLFQHPKSMALRQQELERFLRDAPHLRKVIMFDALFPNHGLGRLLSFIPALESLDLIGESINDEVVRSLTISSEEVLGNSGQSPRSRIVGPNLSRLRLVLYSNCYTPSTLLDMLESRRQASMAVDGETVIPLQRVQLRFEDPPALKPSEQKRLSALATAMDLEIIDISELIGRQ